MTRFLIDTSIWIDLYEDRKGYIGEPLGDYALQLVLNIKLQGDSIVLTDLIIKELELHYTQEKIHAMLKPFEPFEMIKSTHRKEANRIAKQRNVPKGDALLSITARENNLILVSRDKHFSKLTDITHYYKPEELL